MSVRGKWVLDEQSGKLVPEAEYCGRVTREKGPMVINDISEAFVSPVDGSVISSRRELREHNRRNQVADVGNDAAFKNPKRRAIKHQSAAREMARLWNKEK